MNELKIIEEREVLGKDFRIYGNIENPLFLAKDVAEWIEHKDVSTMLKIVDCDEKMKITTIQTISGGLQPNTEYWFLTEDGLYEVLMQSRKPIAKQFKKKVKEILKSVRKEGSYAVQKNLEISQDYLKQIVKETVYQIVPEIFKQLEAKDKREKQIEEEMKRISVQVRNRVEFLLFSENYTYSEISKILEQEGHNITPSTICHYAEHIGLY